MLRSMTGFGRCLVENDGTVQQWEIKSVNGRYLDLKWRLPPFVRYLEPALEKVVRRHADRGHVEISLNLQFGSAEAPKPAFDTIAADAMLAYLAKFASERNIAFQPDCNKLLLVNSLWSEPAIDQEEDLGTQLSGGLAIALEDWNESRTMEGEILGRDLQSRISRMEEWTDIISEKAPEIREERIALLRQRLGESMSAMDAELDQNRVLQEVVCLADRLDVTEELTRLFAHLERLQHLLQQGGDVGRRLDFTLQECFREITTFGNKLADPGLSHLVGDFKNELEKCREQVQNLE